MLLGDCLELLLCLSVVSTVNAQSDAPTTENSKDYLFSQSDAPTTENPRDYLFVKPRNFVKQRATNKTRFTNEEKQLFLQIHNSYRSIVEPPATDMRELVWDEDLEEYAWNHTQKCTGAHSAGTMVKKFNPDLPATWQTWTAMGENLYYSNGQWYSIEEAMWLFWREGKYYDILNQACISGQECGHYRVVTLAKSSRIGCAINVCNNFTKSTYPTPSVYLSCSYNGQYLIYYKPYTVGPRGSDCTYEKQSYDYQYYRNGLCITPFQNLYKTGFDGNTSVVGLPSPYLTTTSAATTSTSASTSTPTTSTTTITASSSPQPTTTESPGTSDTAVTILSTGSSTATPPEITYTSTATSHGITNTSTATPPGITYSTSATPPGITNSTVVVTSHQSDTTSFIFVSSTMARSSTEAATKATGTTEKTEYSSPTIAILTTECSTSISTKHTRIVSQSSRLCSVLPRSVLLLLFFLLPIFDHILYIL